MDTDDLSAYDARRVEGDNYIRECWRALNASTKDAMVRSGFYSERGQRLKVEPFSPEDPSADVERLEYALGVLKQCISAKMPLRSEKGAPIPREALTDNVLQSCEELLYVSEWHDPQFLRLALRAIAAHEQANALFVVGPSSFGTGSVALAMVGGFVKVGLVLLTPLALAAGLVAAHERNLVDAIVAFYVLGAGVLTAIDAKNQNSGLNRSLKERTYSAWSQFSDRRRRGVIGAGAAAQLDLMARSGVNVPSAAFDICAALQHRMTGAIAMPALRGSPKQSRETIPQRGGLKDDPSGAGGGR